MSVNCVIQSCVLNCCNVTGYCPSNSTGCFYYYNTNDDTPGLSGGAIAGIVIGGIFFTIFLVAMIVFHYRRWKRMRYLEQNQGPHITIVSTPVVPVYTYNPQAYGYPPQQPTVYGEPLNPKDLINDGRLNNGAQNEPYNPITNQPPIGRPLIS